MEQLKPTTSSHEEFMQIAIELSERNVLESLGGPFGAVVVKDGKLVAKSGNMVTSTNDPTAHAEISAIRLACTALETFDLTGCVVYTSCEPCPMCLSALYWAKVDYVYYGNTKSDAAKIGFNDQFIYEELEKSAENRNLKLIQLSRTEAQQAFKYWEQSVMRTTY